MDTTSQAVAASNWWTAPWFVAIVIGAIILGSVIAWGSLRNRRRTPGEKQQTAEGTQRIYEREDEDQKV